MYIYIIIYISLYKYPYINYEQIYIKDLISNKWRQIIIPLFESSVIINLNNMYININYITSLNSNNI